MNSVRLDYAKEALKGLANSFYEKELGELLTQRESLLGEVSKLSKEKDLLTEKIESLSTQELELQNIISEKSEELDKIKEDICHIINNKTGIIINEVNEQKERLNSEIDELKSIKKSLEESLEDLKYQVKNYRIIILYLKIMIMMPLNGYLLKKMIQFIVYALVICKSILIL